MFATRSRYDTAADKNIAAMSCITNMAAGITGQALSEQEVLDNAALASENSCAVVKEFIRRINL